MFIVAFTPQHNMKTIGKRDVILGLLKSITDDSLKPDEFTVVDYLAIAKEKGRNTNRQKATRQLNDMADQGQLEKRKACVNARILNVYRKK